MAAHYVAWRVCFIAVALHLWGLKLRVFPKMPKMTSRGQRPPFGTPLVKTPKMNPHGQKPPQFTLEVKTPQIYPLDQKSPNDPHGQKPPKLTPLVKNPSNEPPWPKMPRSCRRCLWVRTKDKIDEGVQLGWASCLFHLKLLNPGILNPI